jgi:hypothetical protein
VNAASLHFFAYRSIAQFTGTTDLIVVGAAGFEPATLPCEGCKAIRSILTNYTRQLNTVTEFPPLSDGIGYTSIAPDVANR